MATEVEDLVGAKLVIGFPGTSVTPQIIRQFERVRAGGVIFYRINFKSPRQLKTLLHDLENALGKRLLVCVDHEGGRVVMYGEGVTVFPDNMATGSAGEVELAEKAGEISARELRALGTDVNFAPVLDVLTETYSPNIGVRSYGKDWKLVARMGAAFIKAHQAGGVSATAKHFPGKGHAPVDAHLRLPTILSTWEEMNETHSQPFLAAIDAGVDVIMSSHPKYPRLDPGPHNIATFSRRIVTDYLRDELGFKGVISSDDLEMGAIKEVCPIGPAAVKAAAAGHDLLLSCHDFESQTRIFSNLVEAYKGKLLPLRELEEGVERVKNLIRKRPRQFEGEPGLHPQGEAVAREIAKRAVRVLQDRDKVIPLSASLSQDVGIIFPRLSALSQKIMIEKELDDEIDFFHHVLGGFPGNHVTELYSISPDEEDIENASQLARRSSVAVFFCFDAHLHKEEQELLASLQRSSRKLIVVLMRDPYDQSFLRPRDVGVTAFGFRKYQLQAVLARLYGEE